MRIFRAEPMTYTPFADPPDIDPILVSAGVTLVDDPRDADIILARMTKPLKKYGEHDKAFAIWTHEPRCSFGANSIQTHYRIRNAIHIMNAYNGSIYTDEFFYFNTPTLTFDDAMQAFAAKPHRAVMLASFRKAPTRVMQDGVDLDLQQYRQELALHLNKHGFCDIHGRNWPKTVDIAGESRLSEWEKAKQEVLKGYAMNIAFESTMIPNYVSEKLWDAIVGACLPVYHGGNGIDRLFPKGSFVDACGKSVQELAEEILAMSKAEMAARYEACLSTYIKIYAKDRQKASRDACCHRTVEFLRRAVAAHATKEDRRAKPAWERAAGYFLPAADATLRAFRQLSFSRDIRTRRSRS